MKKILLWLLCILFSGLLHAQSLDANFSLVTTDNTNKISELKDVKDALSNIDQEIKSKQSEISSTNSKDEIAEYEQEIRVLEQEKKQYWQQFIELSTNVTLQERQVVVEASKRDLVKEMQELVTPMIDTLRRASERPRRIERLKNEIYNLQQEVQPREEASKKLKDLILDPHYSLFNSEIEQSSRLLDREIREMQVELSYKERQLKKELGEKRSFMEEAQALIASFLANKGKNLFFFVLTFVILLWGALWCRKRIFNLKIWEDERFEHLSQPLKGLYGFISFVIALLGAVLCLYLLHDWVLVTLFVILFAGIIWSLKHIFPRFVQEARLILNLGTVREGERIIWNGISWKVIKLGFSSLIKNENLQGATMRIASKDLINLYSRPIVENETWFPTHVGDWVLIDNKNLAKVMTQTPEQVVLEKIGGSRQSLMVLDFWKLKPENLSQGYGIDLYLGIDLALQSLATGEVEANLKKYFCETFLNREGVNELIVEFSDVGPHGLNYYIHLNFNGQLASKRLDMERLMQKTFVDACNLYGYKVPSEQLTIHMQR